MIYGPNFKAVLRQRPPGKAVIFGDRQLTRMNEVATLTQAIAAVCGVFSWRRGGESNPRVKVLQTSALPLGYRAGAGWNYRILFARYRAALAEVNSTRCAAVSDAGITGSSTCEG